MIFSTDLTTSYFALLPIDLYHVIACYFYNSPLPTRLKLNLLAPEVILDTYKNLATAAKPINLLQDRVILLRGRNADDHIPTREEIQKKGEEIAALLKPFEFVYSKVLLKELSKKENLFSLCEVLCGGPAAFSTLPEMDSFCSAEDYKRGKILRAPLPFNWRLNDPLPTEESRILSYEKYMILKICLEKSFKTIYVMIAPNHQKELDIEYNLKIVKMEFRSKGHYTWTTDFFHPKKGLDPVAFLEVCEVIAAESKP